MFKDYYASSTAQRLGVTWLSDRDQLWILSSDVGTAHVDLTASSEWAKTRMSPETLDTIPAEIDELYPRPTEIDELYPS